MAFRSTRSIIAAVAAFMALLTAAMIAYPGGTSWDATTPGHDFWRNYLCDVVRPTALDGTPNPIGSAFGRAAMLALGAGLLPFFWCIAAELRPRAAVTVRVLASAAVLGVPGVVFVSGDRFGGLHAVAVVVAAVGGLAACTAALVGLVVAGHARRATCILGAVTLALGALDFALYVETLGSTSPGPVAVSVLERLTTGSLLVWMAVVALARGRRLRADSLMTRRSSAPVDVCRGSPPPRALDAPERPA